MIVIVDYDMGNVGSILNMLKKMGCKAKISGDPQDIQQAEKIILPGVGAFDQGMTNLHHRGLVSLLNRRVVEDHCAVLGICLGMQLLTSSSEEGVLPGLGWIRAKTRRFRFDDTNSHLKVPHMGWNEVKPVNHPPLFTGYDKVPRFYFVHSYHVCCEDPEDVIGTSAHGYEFTAAVGRGNIFGTQFHPEKSHKYGMTLLKNFASL